MSEKAPQDQQATERAAALRRAAQVAFDQAEGSRGKALLTMADEVEQAAAESSFHEAEHGRTVHPRGTVKVMVVLDRFESSGDAVIEKRVLKVNESVDKVAREMLDGWMEGPDRLECQGDNWFIKTTEGDLDIFAHLIQQS